MEPTYQEALFIIQTLASKGFTSYFAGGWVRDYLLGIPSEDIDIATNAPAETILKIFPKTVPIGLQFGIVLVLIEQKAFEVATFRTDVSYEDGRRPKRVLFTTAQEDALRRDFTINGMFFDPLSKTVIDYVGGQEDLKKQSIRAIGNAYLRIQEDRLRMIRAVRFTCKLGFTLDRQTRIAIKEQAGNLFPYVAMERVMEECRKMFQHRTRKEAFSLLFSLQLLQEIFPTTKTLTFEELERRMVYLERYPENLPLIIYLKGALEERSITSLVTYTKLSNKEKSAGLFFIKSDALFEKKEIDDASWTEFYAHPLSRMYLEVASCAQIDSAHFLQEHGERQDRLKRAILRKKTNKPILSSTYLKAKGIAEGKYFGYLLKKAENIAINENIEDPEELFTRLLKEQK